MKRLREMIAAVETEKAFLRVENSGMKNSLSNSNISYDHLQIFHGSQSNSPGYLEDVRQHSPMAVHTHSHSGSSPSTIVSIRFDDMIDDSCLQVSQSDGPTHLRPDSLLLNNLDLNSTVPDSSLNFDTGASVSTSAQAYSNQSAALQSQLPYLSQTQPSRSTEADISAIAINFILA